MPTRNLVPLALLLLAAFIAVTLYLRWRESASHSRSHFTPAVATNESPVTTELGQSARSLPPRVPIVSVVVDATSSQWTSLKPTLSAGLTAFSSDSPRQYLAWLDSMHLPLPAPLQGERADQFWRSRTAALRGVRLDVDRAVALQFAHLRWDNDDVPPDQLPSQLRTSVRFFSEKVTAEDGNSITSNAPVVSVFVPGIFRMTGLEPRHTLVLDDRPFADVEAYLVLEFMRASDEDPWQLVATGIFGGPHPLFAVPPPW